MKVPFFEVRRSLSELDSLAFAAERVLQSGRYIGGEEVEAFEKECAEFLGVKHAIGVSSGTDALIASLMALGIGPGDGVIVPAFTFVATAAAVCRVGAIPIFCDVQDDDLCLDLRQLPKNIGTPAAAIPVHLFGACAHTDLSEWGVKVIEDAAQAFGSFIGCASEIVCHSFYPTKNLGGFGDGGLVTTDNNFTAEAVRLLRNHGADSTNRYSHDAIGGNFRLDALQAALLRVSLRSLPYALTARRTNVAMYHERLKGVEGIRLPQSHFAGVPNQFVIRVTEEAPRNRDWLREALRLQGIGTEIYYPIPLHLQPCFEDPLSNRPRHRVGDFPVAERAAKQVLALPIFRRLREDEIDYVCEKIREFFR